ncbi:hypothetical protein [Mycobacterium attenuatum]|uniref:hypothetical protein n=1 Tax=Mycobacterium attenuatum TaxID=2341086 RepID=UPI000F0395E2|nr:hypothetical protein [Mycobacterium attenuatum]
MTQPRIETNRTATDLSDVEEESIRRQAREAEGFDPHDDRDVRDGAARLRYALRQVAQQRGAELADDLAHDCGISLDY